MKLKVLGNIMKIIGNLDLKDRDGTIKGGLSITNDSPWLQCHSLS